MLKRMLYIFWFLHQTTTLSINTLSFLRCISFDSYIKPQLVVSIHVLQFVVYLLIPTSNHNSKHKYVEFLTLYIFWFLHQTTTGSVNTCVAVRCISFDSYIKPQLVRSISKGPGSCISFDSYIKPQPDGKYTLKQTVVYLLIPTSNHNGYAVAVKYTQVVYLLIPTSNHN